MSTVRKDVDFACLYDAAILRTCLAQEWTHTHVYIASLPAYRHYRNLAFSVQYPAIGTTVLC